MGLTVKEREGGCGAAVGLTVKERDGYSGVQKQMEKTHRTSTV